MTAEPEAVAPPVQRGPAPPVPTVRAVARTVLPPAPTVRASAHVDGPVVRLPSPTSPAPTMPTPASPTPPSPTPPSPMPMPLPMPASTPGRVRASAAVPSVSPVDSEPTRIAPPPSVPVVHLRNVGAIRPESPFAAGLVPHPREPRSAPKTARPKTPVIVDAAKSGRSETAPETTEPSHGSGKTPVRSNRSKARRAILPIAVAAVAAFVATTAYLAITEPHAKSDVGRWSTAAAANTAAAGGPSWNPAATGNANPFGAIAGTLTGAPTRLKIKAIGVDTSLESLHLGKTGELDPPKSFTKAGWYSDGTVPGDDGPAVIAGHVDSTRGPAVFYKLRELQAGDQIQVVRGGKTVKFTVTSTAWYPKKKFPTDKVYGPTPDQQLRLITCGGVFDHSLRSYKDNLVVYAVAG